MFIFSFIIFLIHNHKNILSYNDKLPIIGDQGLAQITYCHMVNLEKEMYKYQKISVQMKSKVDEQDFILPPHSSPTCSPTSMSMFFVSCENFLLNSSTRVIFTLLC